MKQDKDWDEICPNCLGKMAKNNKYCSYGCYKAAGNKPLDIKKKLEEYAENDKNNMDI